MPEKNDVLDSIDINTIGWSTFYKYRLQIRKSYKNIYKLKLKRRLFTIIAEHLKGNERVLDVGASNGNLGGRVKKEFNLVAYKTMDIDKNNKHDYYSLNEINEPFDLILMTEVIEHIEFVEGLKLLRQLKFLLKQGGKIIITTPNIHHPHRYYWDPDHKVPYRYDALGGVLLYAGFRIEGMYRIYSEPILKYMGRVLMLPLFKLLDIDFARSIAVVATNQQGEE